MPTIAKTYANSVFADTVSSYFRAGGRGGELMKKGVIYRLIFGKGNNGDFTVATYRAGRSC